MKHLFSLSYFDFMAQIKWNKAWLLTFSSGYKGIFISSNKRLYIKHVHINFKCFGGLNLKFTTQVLLNIFSSCIYDLAIVCHKVSKNKRRVPVNGHCVS